MIIQSSHFRELFRLFRQRFVESDALAADSDFDTNLWQILGIIAVPGLYASAMLMGALLEGEERALPLLRGVRIFFAAYSFTVAGFATLFEWDMLFPERRDFLVLTLFPIRLREVFAAKMASLAVLLGVLAATVCAGPLSVLVLVLSLAERAHNLAFVELAFAYIASSLAATVFGFLAVAGLQGILINVTSVRLFRRISPYVQMAGMSLMVLSLILANVAFDVQRHPALLWWFPPYWFAAMQEIFGAKPDPLFRSVGLFGWKVVGCALALFAVTWGAGFARHYRRTLESEDTAMRSLRSRKSYFDWLLHSPQERAVFYFTGAILARSTKHRLFLACYLSVGVAMGIVSGIRMGPGGVGFSPEGLRAFPFLVTFFAVSGFRAAFQFPAELASNWMFQIAESNWGPAARDATRKRVLVGGLLPALLVFLPMEIMHWGAVTGLLHFALEAAAGALLTELLFWTFDKVPFTCSYFPGKMNLALLVAFYLYGFTTYSFTMADFAASAEASPALGIVAVGAAAAALALLWRRKSREEAVRFDGSEPEIQLLDLN